VREIGVGELGIAMGIELDELTAERATARMPVMGNRQPFGLIHGGANAVLAETLGSMAAAVHAGPGRYPVGIELNATHHRSAANGYVYATATSLSLGRTLATHEIVIVDENGKLTCTARLTCFLRDQA
jgi:uncharacterized protein (TIGR00369 family)